ncbi:P-loop NTPase fold protein [uncultured Porphyromonas sp.]|uniref:KAP family P-loop NTPase fold protein n=1 Tax=uncultured Porphyromonas sp. TaxID=159274 RepID=UPI0025F16D22|nr:P-loop NTPase fold protein [uncultured Porphyromonas sp.]
MSNWRFFKRILCWIRGVWSKLKRLCAQKAEVTRQETKAPSSSLSSPIHCAKDDELGFNPKVRKLAKELRELELMGRSTCYGVIAPWGYGKTSFLNLLSKKLSFDGIVVAFNPRSAESAERIQADFFAKLAQELSRYYLGASLIVTRYAEQIGLLNHFSKARLLADVLRLLCVKGDKATVSTAIEKIGKRLYIVLDDLDRLEGKELLETIKLIDVNASFKNTVFLVACDKNYANDVLQDYLGVKPSQGYLDKYITREVHLREYINDKLTNIMAGYLRREIEDGAIVTRKVVLDAWNRIAPYIVPHLGSLRHLKRYYGFFIDEFKRVQDYVDPVDFFLLILLKYKDPGVYEAVKHRIRFQSGSPSFSLYSTDRWNGVSPLSSVDELDLRYYETMEEEYLRDLNNQLDSVIQTAQWNGVVTFLWMLFPNSRMFSDGQLPSDFKDNYWRKSDAPYSSIRYRRGFSSFFPDLIDGDRDSWHQDVLTIVKCTDIDGIYQTLDRRYNEKDAGALVRLILDHLKSFSQPSEHWAIALRVVMYVANRYNDSELKDELGAYLRKSSRFSFDETDDEEVWLIQYKKMINAVFNAAVENYPLLVCELLAPMGNPSRGAILRTYIYTEEEAADLMLRSFEGCFTEYVRCENSRCRAIVNELLQRGSCFMFKKEAAQQFASWIKAHPREGASILLSGKRSSDYRWLDVEFESSLASMEEVGFSVKAWVSSIEDTETREVLEVVVSHRGGKVSCMDIRHDTPLSITYLHEAFTEAGLIQAKR